MLAKKFEDYPPTAEMFKNGNVFSQPKLDGARLIACKDGLFTRQGKKYVSIPHIQEELTPFFKQNPDLILDGELYNHSLRDNFNEIMSLTRKSKPSKEDIELSKKYIQYWIYDLYDNNGFSERTLMLGGLFAEYKEQNKDSSIMILKTKCCTSQHELDAEYSKYLEYGFEGQMVRYDGHPYENKRVNHLLKRKEFQDVEFEIIDIEEGVGNRSGMAGTVLYKLGDKSDRTFRSGIKGGVDFYVKLWKEKDEYKGGTGTVKYFQLTPDGIPRFPVTTAFFKGKRDI